MEQEKNPQISIREILILILGIAVVIAFIGLLILINAHWPTFRRWIEALFWVFVGVIGMVFVIVLIILIKGTEIPNPFNRTQWHRWWMERDINRFRRGRKKLSGWEKEHVQNIENHYRNKIDKRYD